MAQFPNVKFQAVDFEHVSPSVVNTTRSGSDRVLKSQAHFFRFSIRLVPTRYAETRAIQAFLNGLQGQYEPFDVVLPLISDCRGAATVANGFGSAVVAVASADGRTLTLGQLTANVVGALLAGDMIRFANHSKVYQITEDADVDGAGRCSIRLHDRLLVDVPVGTAVVFDQVPFTVRKARDVQPLSLGVGQIVRQEFDCKEVI